MMRNIISFVAIVAFFVAGVTPASAQSRRADRDREVKEYVVDEFFVPGVINDIQFENNQQIDEFIQRQIVPEGDMFAFDFPVGFVNDPGLVRFRFNDSSLNFVEKRDGLRVYLFTIFTDDLLSTHYTAQEVQVRVVKLVSMVRMADGYKQEYARYEVRLNQPLLAGGQILVVVNIRTGLVFKQGFLSTHALRDVDTHPL